ncbi:MAG: MFS transporter [Chloroflexi bacterium]|nr:MFS transporter [Chloroflexota bacterium]
MSLRQAITPERILGRVNANLRMIELGAMPAGSLVAGLLGEIVGLRLALVVGASAGLFGALWLAASPVRHLRGLPPPKLAPPSPADAA